jgi:SAM-dependent methyltransferase
MRFGIKAENPVERVVQRLNLAPVPLIETQMAFTLARVVMAGTQLGVFEALKRGPASAQEVAERCNTDPAATEKLLFALAGCGYLDAPDGRYELTPVARKWLLRDSPESLAGKLEMQFMEWEMIGRSEEYVRTGQPLEIHDTLEGEQWAAYQLGMRSLSGALAPELVRRMPMPKGASDMLDVGGSHGHYSAELCRRHEGLRAVVLDLPPAVESAAELLAAEGMGDRVVHRAGDALADDLGSEAYDLVLVSQLVHHFSAEQNRDLAARIAQALRPGGVYAIFDAFRPPTPGEAGQLGALLEFYFALTSQSGTWAPEEMGEWQRQAGLRPRRTIRLRTAPGAGIQAAVKP